MKNIALIGTGYWGSKIKKYIPEYFNLKYEANSSFDKNIIWDDEKIKAVIIATPIETHYKLTKKALENNKHVFVEKPLALTYDECTELIELANKKNLKLGVEYTQTFAPSIKKLKSLITNLKDIQYIEMSTKHLGRFMNYNVYWLLASHHLSILSTLFPLQIFYFSFTNKICNDKSCTTGEIVFTPKNGMGLPHGNINVSLNFPGKEMYFNIYTKNSTIKWNALNENTIQYTKYNKKYAALPDALTDNIEEFRFDENNNLKYSVKYFQDLLNNKEKSNAEIAAQITKILE